VSRAGDWIRPEVQALAAYHVPEVGDVVKLDAMENPYTWPDEDIRAEWAACLAGIGVNRYPDPRATEVAARLREHTALPIDQALLLGNGSDELIQLVTLALARPGAKVLAPEPTFVMYRMIATFCGLEFIGVPLAADFGLDMPALEAAIEEHDPAVVWLAWPNNPTGNAWSRTDVLRVADLARGLVVVDEAYQPFAQDSFISELGERDNLLVLRTLSKLGLAGLRLGFLAGPPAWLGEIDKLRLPYNVNALTQAGAAFALDHFERLERQATEIRRERDALAVKLATLPGVNVYPSAANFILLRVPYGHARTLFEGLLAEGILIKCLDGTHPALTDCLRITVGTPPENALLAEALQRRLSEVA
jgi:histidinol-phosphate aminotransferase